MPLESNTASPRGKWSRIERGYRLLVEVAHALLEVPGEAELVQEACKRAVTVAGYRLAWVGYVEHEPPYAVRPIAQYGYDDGYVSMANITWRAGERGDGPTGRAVRTGTTQVAQNIATAAELAPWREDALARGYASSAAVPLAWDGQTCGVLSVYAFESDAFDEREVELLQAVAADLTLGIRAARGRQELGRLQSRLGRRSALSQVACSTAVYAHDMANHLQIIGALVDEVLDVASGVPDELAAATGSSIKRAIQETRDVLAGSKKVADGALVVDAVLEAARAPIARQIDPCQLVLDLRAPEARVRIAELALDSVVMNLAANAREAMPDGGTLTITTGLTRLQHPMSARTLGANPGLYLTLRVTDTGIGIPAAKQGRVFDPLFTTKPAGTGVGLAAVYDVVVTQADGVIWLESEPGVGTTIEVLLPASLAGP